MATYIDIGLYDPLHQKLKTDDDTECYVHSYVALQQYHRFMLQIALQKAVFPSVNISHRFGEGNFMTLVKRGRTQRQESHDYSL